MSEKIRVRQSWTYKHVRPVESFSIAGASGDTVISDRRDTIIYFNANGDEVWSKKVDFSPLKVRITSDGSSVFVLTFDGRLMRISRDAELEWELWVTKDVNNLAIKSKGQAAVVTSHKGRFHVINSAGKRGRIVHTPEPVSSARISARSGSLFVASPFGWVGLYDNKFSPLGEYNLNMPVAAVEVSEWGKRLFLPAREDGLNVIELAEGRMTQFHPGFPVARVGIDEKGDKLLAAGLEGGIALMDIQGKKLWETNTDHSWALCEMNSGGNRFVMVSDKGVVACYSIGTSVDKSKSAFDYLEMDKASTKKKDSGNDFDYLEI